MTLLWHYYEIHYNIHYDTRDHYDTIITLLSHHYDIIITLLSHYYHNIMTLLSHYYDTIMTILWLYYHTIMTVLSQYHNTLWQYYTYYDGIDAPHFSECARRSLLPEHGEIIMKWALSLELDFNKQVGTQLPRKAAGVSCPVLLYTL